MDRGAWQATVHGVSKSLTQLSDYHSLTLCILTYTNGAYWGFPGGSDGKESTCSAGDPGLIPGSGRSPGEGNGSPLQCSYPGNSMDRGAWWATVHGVAKSWTRLSNFTFFLREVP